MKNKIVSLAAVFVTAVSFAGVIFPQTAQAAFPGANGMIAFNSNRDGNNEIYRLNSDSTNPINLTNNAASDTSASWSADGTKIAFNSDRDGNSEIYIMNADGTSQMRLTNNSASDANPAWSPDGTKIVFTSARDGNSEIYIMNADGSGQTNITNNPASQTNTNWSPDGTKIVYQTGITIRTINIDGTNDVLISAGNNPNWSPDGTKIAFNHDFGGGQGQEVYYINLDGTGLTQVTANAATNAVPAWSPDSSKIVFRSVRDGNNEIYSINSNGTGEARLTSNLFDDNTPDWQPLTIPPAVANDSTTIAVPGVPNTGFGSDGTRNALLFIFLGSFMLVLVAATKKLRTNK